MKVVTLSRGGQISIPAEIRKRWPSNKAFVRELADGSVVLEPIPADPIRAAIGSLKGPGPTVEEMLEQERLEEIEADERERRMFERP